MFVSLKRGRSLDCIGDLRFDQWRASELEAADASQLTQHLASCQRCRERQTLHDQARERYAVTLEPNPEWLARANVPARPSFSWYRLAFGTAIALAVALSLSLALQRRDPFLFKLPRLGLLGPWGLSTLSPTTRRLPSVALYVQRGQLLRPAVNAQILYPSDRLRFVYTATRPQYLAILSLDGAAHASVCFPQTEARAARLEPGRNEPLPVSVTLGASSGEATVVAVFCEQGFELEPMRAALEQEWSSLRVPAGCSTQELHVMQRSQAL